MKVCTDACLFGAWVAEQMLNQNIQPEHILDIGAGTGLLSLMLTQKLNSPADAVEIEHPDFVQCRNNFEQSAWSNRLHAHHSDVKNFIPVIPYDLIISNPPFFENDLKPSEPGKHRAKHELTLGLRELFTEAERLLSADGSFALLLPHHRTAESLEIATGKGFSAYFLCRVKQTPKHEPFRVMLLFRKAKTITEETGIIIKERNNEYTPVFTTLLKDYYLYL